MNRRICSVFVGLALVLLTAELAARDKLKETSYYPLQVGNTWHYRAGDGKFTIRVVKHEKVGDTLCALLESRRDGKLVGSEHLAVADDGVYRHDLILRVPQPDSKDKDKSVKQPIQEMLKPPVLVLKLPPKNGDAWKVESTSGSKTFRSEFHVEAEEITVPAGTYKTFRVTSRDLEVNGLNPTITTFFAEGVGMVQQIVEVGDAKIEIELEKFEASGK